MRRVYNTKYYFTYTFSGEIKVAKIETYQFPQYAKIIFLNACILSLVRNHLLKRDRGISPRLIHKYQIRS